MAASDRGLQSVPRGLDRNLTTYLQAIRTELLRLSGLVRGSDQSRAVRASEASAAFGGGSVSTPSGSVDVAAIASQIFRDGSVTERKLADRAVTGGKVADNAVTARTIAPGEVDNNALAEQAVTAGKLADGAVTAGALANGCVTRGKLAEDAVDTRNLMDGAVASDKIEEGAVTTERLGDWAVTFYKISPGAVGTESIRDGSVTAKKLAKGALPPAWASGDAKDGETVAIPGNWDGRPAVFLTGWSCIVPEADPETGERRITVGPERFTEALDADGAGTGVWSFAARGDFSWMAMGRAKEEAGT